MRCCRIESTSSSCPCRPPWSMLLSSGERASGWGGVVGVERGGLGAKGRREGEGGERERDAGISRTLTQAPNSSAKRRAHAHRRAHASRLHACICILLCLCSLPPTLHLFPASSPRVRKHDSDLLAAADIFLIGLRRAEKPSCSFRRQVGVVVGIWSVGLVACRRRWMVCSVENHHGSRAR